MITPMDIHNKTFSRQIRGYAQDEVNTFLEELAKDYERIYREHREMEEEMDTIRTKLRNYEKMESTMSNTLVMAQETADNVKKNAHKEAELSIREAQNEAHKIVADAESARRKMNADLLKTEGDMNLYIEKLLSNFKSALSLIESAKAVKAPQPVEDGTAKPAPAAAEAPKAEEPKEEAKEEPAPEVQEAAPAAETAENPAGGNLFDQAAATAKGEEPAAEPAEDTANRE
ncbi:DivIVA domain-containing protein [uncultured Dialister sp.]|uniref:DivIVA domain-containing protein n=1 Tax=uncultured Dialister sp. TaxID=278064 RepID=UPI00261E428B|nr:DivIVA domain-containing protein [uncultured Dialister sp.]